MARNDKLYTGPRLPCGWPKCVATLKNPSQLVQHWCVCFGHGLPPLKTGIKCDIKKCRCRGVDFPSEERLLKHKVHEAKVAWNAKNEMQCLSPVCGCGLWFRDLPQHLRVVGKRQEAIKEMEREVQPRQSDKYQGRRTKGSQNIGHEDAEELVIFNQDFGEKNMTKVKVHPKEVGEDDEDDEYHPALKISKAEKIKGEATGHNVKVEAHDNVSFHSTNPAKRKRVTVDLTGDSDDESAVEVVKKVQAAPFITAAQIDYSTLEQRPDAISTLFEIIKSQQNQIQMLAEAVIKRK